MAVQSDTQLHNLLLVICVLPALIGLCIFVFCYFSFKMLIMQCGNDHAGYELSLMISKLSKQSGAFYMFLLILEAIGQL